MKNRFFAYLLLVLSGLLYVLFAATLLSMLQAFTVRDTITAVESAFGTFVLLLMLLWAARRSWSAGKKRLKQEDDEVGSRGTKP